ncbi:MAG: DUF3617 family protein [Magnetococcales bacterium]|nr:DUF3617 family protein [Magnetococcales bacterium]
MRTLPLFLFVAALAQGSIAQAADLNAEEGLYDITLQTEMPGMPMPSQNMRQCITQADIKNPQNILKKANQADDCVMKDIKQTSNKISFAVTCPKEKFSGQGEYNFSGNTYTGVMNMSMPNPMANDKPMPMTVKTTAKRMGPCK